MGQTTLPVPGKILLFARLAMAAVWLYEGLWLKILDRTPGEVQVVQSALGSFGLPALPVLKTIGVAETALAAALIVNLLPKITGWVQLILLLTMHTVAGLTHSLSSPVDLYVHCAPMYVCIVLLIWAGRQPVE